MSKNRKKDPLAPGLDVTVKDLLPFVDLNAILNPSNDILKEQEVSIKRYDKLEVDELKLPSVNTSAIGGAAGVPQISGVLAPFRKDRLTQTQYAAVVTYVTDTAKSIAEKINSVLDEIPPDFGPAALYAVEDLLGVVKVRQTPGAHISPMHYAKYTQLRSIEKTEANPSLSEMSSAFHVRITRIAQVAEMLHLRKVIPTTRRQTDEDIILRFSESLDGLAGNKVVSFSLGDIYTIKLSTLLHIAKNSNQLATSRVQANQINFIVDNVSYSTRTILQRTPIFTMDPNGNRIFSRVGGAVRTHLAVGPSDCYTAFSVADAVLDNNVLMYETEAGLKEISERNIMIPFEGRDTSIIFPFGSKVVDPKKVVTPASILTFTNDEISSADKAISAILGGSPWVDVEKILTETSPNVKRYLILTLETRRSLFDGVNHPLSDVEMRADGNAIDIIRMGLRDVKVTVPLNGASTIIDEIATISKAITFLIKSL